MLDHHLHLTSHRHEYLRRDLLHGSLYTASPGCWLRNTRVPPDYCSCFFFFRHGDPLLSNKRKSRREVHEILNYSVLFNTIDRKTTQLTEKMIHTCTGLCKLFVNKLCSGSIFFYNKGSVVGFTLAEVEEQRRACRGCIREHGPDTLVAEQQKQA